MGGQWCNLANVTLKNSADLAGMQNTYRLYVTMTQSVSNWTWIINDTYILIDTKKNLSNWTWMIHLSWLIQRRTLEPLLLEGPGSLLLWKSMKTMYSQWQSKTINQEQNSYQVRRSLSEPVIGPHYVTVHYYPCIFVLYVILIIPNKICRRCFLTRYSVPFFFCKCNSSWFLHRIS